MRNSPLFPDVPPTILLPLRSAAGGLPVDQCSAAMSAAGALPCFRGEESWGACHGAQACPVRGRCATPLQKATAGERPMNSSGVNVYK